MTICKAIDEVVHRIYKKDDFNRVQDCEPIRQVMSYFGLDEKEDALLTCYFINKFLEEEFVWCNIQDLCRDIDVSVLESYSYVVNLDRLLQKKIFCLRNKVPYVKGSASPYTQFSFDFLLTTCLSKNLPFQTYTLDENTDFKYDILSFFSEIVNTEPSFFKKPSAVTNFLQPYLKDPWIFKLISALTSSQGKSSKPQPVPDRPMVDVAEADVLGREYNLENYVKLTPDLKCFFGLVQNLYELKSVALKSAVNYGLQVSEVVQIIKAVKTGEHPFIKGGYFETEPTDIADSISLVWGETIKEAFKDFPDWLIVENHSKELNKIEYTAIKEKQLFYNTENQKDIDRLEHIVSEDQYQLLKQRLQEKSLPSGLTILLYGAPGTGKTETVLQLARKTGRDVYHLNIEQVKSCWVGESEKNIKNIFKSYYASKSGKKPILLFNEADAIISKRTLVDGKNAAVIKMENAIQNLLLEELEKFDGIFVATSNLVDNIDEAFDRRLLFKLKFENPTPDVKAKIWTSRLSFIEDSTAQELSRTFDLSGGQIENVYRKSEIDYILYGSYPDKTALIDFCRKEKLNGDSAQRIGF